MIYVITFMTPDVFILPLITHYYEGFQFVHLCSCAFSSGLWQEPVSVHDPPSGRSRRHRHHSDGFGAERLLEHHASPPPEELDSKHEALVL